MSTLECLDAVAPGFGLSLHAKTPAPLSHQATALLGWQKPLCPLPLRREERSHSVGRRCAGSLVMWPLSGRADRACPEVFSEAKRSLYVGAPRRESPRWVWRIYEVGPASSAGGEGCVRVGQEGGGGRSAALSQFVESVWQAPPQPGRAALAPDGSPLSVPPFPSSFRSVSHCLPLPSPLHFALVPCHKECGPWTSSISTTQRL